MLSVVSLLSLSCLERPSQTLFLCALLSFESQPLLCCCEKHLWSWRQREGGEGAPPRSTKRAGTSRAARMVNPSKDVLDDLCMRFVLNCPEEELRSWERLLFQVEQAHWFYEDHIRPENTKLKSFALKDFVKTLFENCSVLKPYKAQVGEILSQFNAYKLLVPVMGAIIMDEEMEHCLLLRGVKSSSSWGFPKGKVDENEADINCAVREVLEETSLDISSMVSEEDAIEITVRSQRRKMYLVHGVDRQTLFAPQMRGEVGNYAWMPISELPTKKEAEGAGVMTEEEGRCKFWAVWRFVKPLKSWIKKQKQKKKKKQKDKLVVLKKKKKTATTAATSATTAALPPPKKASPLSKNFVPAGGSEAKTKAPTLFSVEDFRFDKEAILSQLELGLVGLTGKA